MAEITPGVSVADFASGVTSGTPVTPKPDNKSVPSSAKKRTRARKSDSPPKQKSERTAPPLPTDFTTAAIADALAEVLTFPAVPCSVIGDEWAAQHFTVQGRQFAEQLAKQSEKNPTLRKWCIRLAQGESFGILVMSGVLYALPPMIHWGIVPRPNFPMPGIPMPPERDTEASTAAQAMGDNSSNGSNTSSTSPRTERHTP